MKITKEFLNLGVFEYTLNKTQCSILNIPYPLEYNWQELVIDKELSLRDTNLFLFLRGKLSIKAQEQIVKNYKLVADFHKPKREVEVPVDFHKPKREVPAEVKKIYNIENQCLIIYCDGACKANPGKSGSGIAIYETNGERKPILLYGDYNPKGTNNTAELNALYESLLIASKTKEAVIYSDSKYSIDCIKTWAYSWKKKGWKKKSGEIKNLELIKLSHNLYEEIKDKVQIRYVKAHSGDEGNELADRMANVAILNKTKEYKSYEYTSLNGIL